MTDKTIIYQIPGRHKGPKGTTYNYRSANVGDKIPDGWHACLHEAADALTNPKPKRGRKPKANPEGEE